MRIEDEEARHIDYSKVDSTQSDFQAQVRQDRSPVAVACYLNSRTRRLMNTPASSSPCGVIYLETQGPFLFQDEGPPAQSS